MNAKESLSCLEFNVSLNGDKKMQQGYNFCQTNAWDSAPLLINKQKPPGKPCCSLKLGKDVGVDVSS